MKKTFLLITLSLAYMLSQAQSDSWKIKWNKKVLLETTKSDENGNIKRIKKSELNKSYSLEITYKEADAKKEKAWRRSILFFDDNNQEILRKDSTRNVKLSAAELKKLFGDKNKIRIYT